MEKEPPDRLTRLSKIRETSLRNPPSLVQAKQNSWIEDLSRLDKQGEQFPQKDKSSADRPAGNRRRKIKARSRSNVLESRNFRSVEDRNKELEASLSSARSSALNTRHSKTAKSRTRYKREDEVIGLKAWIKEKTWFYCLLGLGILAILIIITSFPRSYWQPLQQIPVAVPSLGASGSPTNGQPVFNEPSGHPLPSASPSGRVNGLGTYTAAQIGAIKPAVENGIIVHVTGCVKKPGVVVIPAGSRVVDAVNLAGGVNEQANPSAINMARKLVDGEHVHVPSVQDKAPVDPQSNGGGNDSNNSASGNLVINLNQASSAQIEGIPGIGPALAKRILDYRQAKGNFSSIDELSKVAGIGPSLLSRLRPHLTV